MCFENHWIQVAAESKGCRSQFQDDMTLAAAFLYSQSTLYFNMTKLYLSVSKVYDILPLPIFPTSQNVLPVFFRHWLGENQDVTMLAMMTVLAILSILAMKTVLAMSATIRKKKTNFKASCCLLH